jgi:hypothetical protein
MCVRPARAVCVNLVVAERPAYGARGHEIAGVGTAVGQSVSRFSCDQAGVGTDGRQLRRLWQVLVRCYGSGGIRFLKERGGEHPRRDIPKAIIDGVDDAILRYPSRTGRPVRDRRGRSLERYLRCRPDRLCGRQATV